MHGARAFRVHGTQRAHPELRCAQNTGADAYNTVMHETDLQICRDVLSPFLFIILMSYVLKMADKRRRDIVDPSMPDLGDVTAECTVCSKEFYIRVCMDPFADMCAECRQVKRETAHLWNEEKEDSDDGDPTQPLVPSQEQADDIHLIATDSAELQEILVKIQHIGKLHAGFDFQLRKTKQMEVRDTIKAGKTTLPDVLALEHKHACLLCGLPMGERSVHTHTRYCKKRKRKAVAQWVNDDDDDAEWEFEAVLEILGPPQGPGVRFVRMKWKGWSDLGTGDGTADFYWERRADMLENQNYSVLEKQFWAANKNLKRHKCLEKTRYAPLHMVQPSGFRQCGRQGRTFRQ